MSRKVFSDECQGCRPAVFHPETGRVLSNDDPVMVKVNVVWETTTREEREAFHRVTCLNSRAPEDLSVMQGLIRRIQASVVGKEPPS